MPNTNYNSSRVWLENNCPILLKRMQLSIEETDALLDECIKLPLTNEAVSIDMDRVFLIIERALSKIKSNTSGVNKTLLSKKYPSFMEKLNPSSAEIDSILFECMQPDYTNICGVGLNLDASMTLIENGLNSVNYN